jgi:hypothetical protein
MVETQKPKCKISFLFQFKKNIDFYSALSDLTISHSKKAPEMAIIPTIKPSFNKAKAAPKPNSFVLPKN